MTKPLLAVRDLRVAFGTGPPAVDGVSFDLAPGEVLGLVGESGCGKSTLALALMRLLSGAHVRGEARLGGDNLLALDEAAMRRLRGARIGMVFQDPMSALHPLIRVGAQVAQAIRAHEAVSAAAAMQRAAELFRQVGISAPERRLRAYPHELSGGMCQRVVIAQAIACRPRLLLADEPTTALDVTVQAQILKLLRGIVRESGMAMVLITHDLGVVAGQADRVAVMYVGRIIEHAPAEALFAHPAHPYTRGLLAAVPALHAGWDAPLPTIPGSSARAYGAGCRFAPRCPHVAEICARAPDLAPIAAGHAAACWKAEDVAAAA